MLTLLATAIMASAAADEIKPIPSPDDFERWFAHVDAGPDELAWKTGIDWHQTFGAALVDARETDRPVLLYVAAGDPQGCT